MGAAEPAEQEDLETKGHHIAETPDMVGLRVLQVGSVGEKPLSADPATPVKPPNQIGDA